MALSISEGPPYPSPGAWSALARPTGLVLSPLLIVQGKLVRRSRDRLPNASPPWSGRIRGPKPLRLLGLGDSTIAGVGVADARDGLVAQVSRELSVALGRGVHYDSIGERGITSSTLFDSYIPQLATQERGIDWVILSIGANDAKSLVSRQKTLRAVRATLDAIHSHSPEAVILVSSLPAFRYFVSLPQPLRAVMSGHAQSMEAKLRPEVESRPYALMSRPPRHYPPEFFASDGFHPGVEGYRLWARFAVDDARERGALRHLEAR